ncbi:hypothetical protein CDD80_6713 [Ophiocordyceps camponoti-rufipedis]|uniref:Uncharacterized protein n=1 Tax=Ophiocordyceps camponoti-rufipedis TaxID=2004952 RepID=A0A2C5ZGG3_9HYPO|nr:hypothetical protein CDD80_6713 [Ophiocordyceps camponoti-rufipedis]
MLGGAALLGAVSGQAGILVAVSAGLLLHVFGRPALQNHLLDKVAKPELEKLESKKYLKETLVAEWEQSIGKKLIQGLDESSETSARLVQEFQKRSAYTAYLTAEDIAGITQLAALPGTKDDDEKDLIEVVLPESQMQMCRILRVQKELAIETIYSSVRISTMKLMGQIYDEVVQLMAGYGDADRTAKVKRILEDIVRDELLSKALHLMETFADRNMMDCVSSSLKREFSGTEDEDISGHVLDWWQAAMQKGAVPRHMERNIEPKLTPVERWRTNNLEKRLNETGPEKSTRETGKCHRPSMNSDFLALHVIDSIRA